MRLKLWNQTLNDGHTKVTETKIEEWRPWPELWDSISAGQNVLKSWSTCQKNPDNGSYSGATTPYND